MQCVPQSKLNEAAIIKVEVRRDITIHWPGNDGVPTSTCYVEFTDARIPTIVLMSPCPYKFQA